MDPLPRFEPDSPCKRPSTTDEGRWRRWMVVLENLQRYVNGEKMLNVVNVKRGY